MTKSDFRYKRKRGHIDASPARAVTQIRANWLDLVEPDPDAEEIEAARIQLLKEAEEDQQDEHEGEKRNQNQQQQPTVIKTSTNNTLTPNFFLSPQVIAAAAIDKTPSFTSTITTNDSVIQQKKDNTTDPQKSVLNVWTPFEINAALSSGNGIPFPLCSLL
jgi:hypothetical protein